MFSRRTDWDLAESDFSVAASERRRQPGFCDLTLSNPTHCGFSYPPDLLASVADPSAALYDPAPLGARLAREAVSAYYADHGASVPIANLCLTTSTSEAYSFLFRLLCDPGDDVLIARPSYPLFDYIARLDSLTLREFPLHYDPGADARQAHGWSIDLHALEQSIGPRTRALILVHPNNPTGNYVSGDERRALELLCVQHSLALIVDEVFLDYALSAEAPGSFAETAGDALCFVLSGLSKVCALPQMKASWIAATGPSSLVQTAMSRLEVIADTFLSMNAPIQNALPQWLASRGAMQSQIIERVRANLATLDERLLNTTAHRLALEGGWTAVLRVPRTVDCIPFAEAALDLGVLTQPGEFYGLPEGRAVLSLLTPPNIWARGLARLPID